MTSPDGHPARFGYHGYFLRVDVSGGKAERISIDGEILRGYLGGSGLGTWLLLREGAATTEPLGPQAPLAFVFSPLVGSPLTTSAKFAVVGKSPLTDRINDSLASSQFAIAGKRTGCDAIVINGRAPEPSVLIVDNGQVRLEPAGELWGRTIPQTQRMLRERFGAGYASAVIGPAGESCVRFATISHGGRHAGRGGSGAVMGAKNLKAILVRGDQRCGWADPAGLIRYAKQLSSASFGPATAKYRELGTAANVLVFNRLSALPTRNFTHGTFSQAGHLSPEVLANSRERVRASCAACTIGCEHIYSLGERRRGSPGEMVRVEYESLFALGSLCEIGDATPVLAAAHRCDELGLDTISLGGTVAFAMECVDRGLLPEPWLRFGSGEALLRSIELIAGREGIGNDLAEGSRRLAQQIGHDTIDFAPQVKGLEMPGYEPRALQTMALGLAVGTRGADHNRSSAYEADFSERVDRRRLTPQAARWAVDTEDRATIMDSLILCKFLRGVFADFYQAAAEMLGLVTGWNVTAGELQMTARRIVDAKKEFNIQAGWTPAEDTLPRRFFQHPLADDPEAVLSEQQLRDAITAYNRHRGWTDDGYVVASQS